MRSKYTMSVLALRLFVALLISFVSTLLLFYFSFYFANMFEFPPLVALPGSMAVVLSAAISLFSASFAYDGGKGGFWLASGMSLAALVLVFLLHLLSTLAYVFFLFVTDKL